ncbi:hypothetical protein [Chelativorans alearense]|uniref:hypothetical protein n=1 Tax=Chelativorans alearense TaxID=2681495 RepID=UPI0013D6CC43|nr:hypothetical protein [Chelativorans alearense]
MALKTRKYDPARYLTSEDALDEYLLATYEDGSPPEIARASDIVTRMRTILRKGRESRPD